MEVSQDAKASARILEKIAQVKEWEFFSRRCEIVGPRCFEASKEEHRMVRWEGAALIAALKSVYGE